VYPVKHANFLCRLGREKWVGESPPIQTLSQHRATHRRKKEKGHWHHRLPGSSSSAICPWGSRRPLGLMTVAAASEYCKLTMQTERIVGLRPPEKGAGVCCRRSSLVLAAPLGCSAVPAPLPEPNVIAVLSERRVEAGAGGGECWG
jgi:hypothetical protein